MQRRAHIVSIVFIEGGSMSKSKKWLALALAVALVLAVALTGCSAKTEEPTSEEPTETMTLETIESGKLLVGSDTAFPPFESMNGDVAEGFDVDLMKAIGDKLGLEVVFQTEIFDTLIPTLKAGGKFDVIASGMTIKPDRQLEIDFTDAYYDSNQSLVMTKGTAYTGPEQLAGKKIGVQSGTTGEAWAKENVEGATLVPFKNATDAFAALQAGNVDAVVNDLPVSTELLKDDDRGMEIVSQIPTGEQYGFGVSKDNPELTAAINKALGELRTDGTYNEIYQKWFGILPE
ncbi:MAG: amino acid ABC transporter substrate-binding protein [Actinobacteria bacterium HGW-Actinobacteria-6]|jgi:polar amino acid transport system substrate-binding protein|nr:MAG: amino acid ABC transporter substrate-binding protein [Actinobacteria bacterium HGW-Actinobacteria-6]